MSFRLLAALTGVLLCSGSALADELGERVRSLYRPYEGENAEPRAAADVIKPMASRRLAALLDRDDKCAKRNGVCALGHDVIANGQDFRIEKVQVSDAETKGDKATVVARFLNMGGRFETRYEFVREADAWKLDDMVALQPKEYRWRLTSLLAPKGRGR